jgi:hypothetical protein
LVRPDGCRDRRRRELEVVQGTRGPGLATGLAVLVFAAVVVAQIDGTEL